MQRDYIEFKDSPAEFKMIFIEGGVFDMGGESGYDDTKPIRKVRLSEYWMGEFLVTQAVWKWVMRGTDIADPSSFKGNKNPVERVSWEDIVNDFLPRINQMTKQFRPLGTIYRLPTEAEWEYGAKGGKHSQLYPFEYAGSNKLEEVCWYRENSYEATKVVGLKTSNLLGLYDMSGNIWEWCDDWYKSYNVSVKAISINPKGPYIGTHRVLRGGSWFRYGQDCRSIFRDRYTPAERYRNVGLRLVLCFYPLQVFPAIT